MTPKKFCDLGFRALSMKTSFPAILAFILTACGPAKKPEQMAIPVEVKPTPTPIDGNSLPRSVDDVRALSSKYPKEAVNLLLRRMEAALPKGWSASYDKEYSFV